MDERLWMGARLLEGEKMAPLCAEFGNSRKTGYKIYDRYKDCGVGAFSDRSRRPHRQANRGSKEVRVEGLHGKALKAESPLRHEGPRPPGKTGQPLYGVSHFRHQVGTPVVLASAA